MNNSGESQGNDGRPPDIPAAGSAENVPRNTTGVAAEKGGPPPEEKELGNGAELDAVPPDATPHQIPPDATQIKKENG